MNNNKQLEKLLLYDELISEYDKIYVKALASPYVKKPESYALYHLWKKWNAQEKSREVEE